MCEERFVPQSRQRAPTGVITVHLGQMGVSQRPHRRRVRVLLWRAQKYTPGSPGTATPTPYPQITPITLPKSGAGSGSPPLVPIEMPSPPSKDQPVPGIEPNGNKAKSPGG